MPATASVCTKEERKKKKQLAAQKRWLHSLHGGGRPRAPCVTFYNCTCSRQTCHRLRTGYTRNLGNPERSCMHAPPPPPPPPPLLILLLDASVCVLATTRNFGAPHGVERRRGIDDIMSVGGGGCSFCEGQKKQPDAQCGLQLQSWSIGRGERRERSGWNEATVCVCAPVCEWRDTHTHTHTHARIRQLSGYYLSLFEQVAPFLPTQAQWRTVIT